MARPLDVILASEQTKEDQPRERRLVRSTARAFAAAISSLVITTLVVNTSAEALRAEGTVSGNSFEAGTITLLDDDAGRSLVQLDGMSPSRALERCIRIEYAGTILPVDLTLVANVTGDLAPYLAVEVEKGAGAGYESCAGFEPKDQVFSGTLSRLAAIDATYLDTLRNQGDTVSFRFRFELLDDERAVGRSATVDFVWEVVPS